MTALNRKLLRDMFLMKGQAVAITFVIAAGIATFVMSLTTLEALERTQAAYYERYRFAHVFAQLKRAPNALAARIAAIPGVAAVQTRVVVDVTIDVEDLSEPAVERLISIPERRTPGLNDVYLRAGRYIEPERTGEILLSEAFATAHAFHPGDSLVAVINGHRQRLDIVGIALSPEYVIQLRGTDLLPDDKRFAVGWMGYTDLAAAFNMEGAFNNVTLMLMPGAREQEVIDRLDQLIEPYGGVGAYGRSDQLSHRYLTDEIRQLKIMATMTPAIFLGVAAFLLNVVLNRLISTQREQIAALKAFGYTRLEVGWHYLKFALVIVFLGVVLGSGFGTWMGLGMTRLYARFYHFPAYLYDLSPPVIVAALAIATASAVVGTMAAVRRAAALPPAEAMRPEPPATFRPTIVERMGLSEFLPPAARMILRQLERQPIKAMTSCLGVAMAVAVLVLGSFGMDAMDYIMDFQFSLAQRQDVNVAFVEPTSPGVIHDIQHLPGVIHCEPFRAAATRLRFGHRSRRVGIMGIENDGDLFRLLNADESRVDLPPDGLTLSTKLAEILGVELGDFVTVEVLEGERPVLQVPVTAMVTEYGGLNAYMDVWALGRLLRDGDSLTGALVSVDPLHRDALYTELKATPRVAAVTITQASLESFRETVAENLLRFRLFNIGFASIIAIGVVYNNARVSLSERSRELATLRVIGFTRAEISMILLGELAVVTLVAIPLGLLIGFGFAAVLSLGLDTEVYRIPLVINQSTYAFAAVVVIIAASFSGLIVRRRLDHLDLVSVLKSKE